MPGVRPRFVAIAARGTETVLAEELRALGLEPVEEGRGAVRFGRALADGYRSCLWSRIASRILLPIGSFEAPDPAALYAGVHALPWLDHLDPRHTFAVSCVASHDAAVNTRYLALKSKDAIVDRIRSERGTRPSVDRTDPDLRVHVHLDGARATVSLDLSGEGLHRRGIGRTGAAAPLKENLAAALLAFAGWPRLAPSGIPLLDPMCGSATLLVEAAWIALDRAPGLTRRRFGFERWLGHESDAWRKLIDEAQQRARRGAARPVLLFGFDHADPALEAARRNLRAAGLERVVRLERRELADAAPPAGLPDPPPDAPRGLVITNPPYGERLGRSGELGPLYRILGDVLRRRFGGWTAFVLAGDPELAGWIGLRPARRRPLHNGPIECRLLEIPLSTRAVRSDRGPGWRRPSPEASAFANRLRKNLQRLEPWAARERLEAWRVYDGDVPEYNVAVDRYGDRVRVEEYAPPRSVSAADADRRRRDVLAVVPEALAVPPDRIVFRVRERRGTAPLPEKRDATGRRFAVREGDLRFLVNLDDYLDTGLFLDGRIVRARIGAAAEGRRFLDLFAYTCTAACCAAAGGAARTVSVDLSGTYLDWGRENLALNGRDGPGHRLDRADAIEWLAGSRESFDLVLLAPPAASRSSRMARPFDLARDLPSLIRAAAGRLAPGGTLLFVCPVAALEVPPDVSPGLRAREITRETTPRDFERRPRQRVWVIETPARSRR